MYVLLTFRFKKYKLYIYIYLCMFNCCVNRSDQRGLELVTHQQCLKTQQNSVEMKPFIFVTWI